MRSNEEDAELEPKKKEKWFEKQPPPHQPVGLKVCRPWEVVAFTIQAHSLSRSNQVYNNLHVASTLLRLLNCKMEKQLKESGIGEKMRKWNEWKGKA